MYSLLQWTHLIKEGSLGVPLYTWADKACFLEIIEGIFDTQSRIIAVW